MPFEDEEENSALVPVDASGLNPENYDEDIEAINKEMKDLDDLYKESKAELDRVRASRSRGSLSFTHMQTANLISIKSQKLSLLKARQAIKKDRFKQNLQVNMLTGGNKNEIPAFRVLEVLAANGMNFEQIQRQSKIHAAEEAAFEEAVDAELAEDNKEVSTAENELKEFEAKPYVPPKEETPEEEKCVEEQEFNPKTEVYEVVCDRTGKLFVIDLEQSTIEDTKFFDLEVIGLSEEDKATVITGEDGLITARFRDHDIEVVEFSDGK